MGLLLGNPNPRLPWNNLLSLDSNSVCLDEDVSKYDPGEIKSSSDLGAQESLNGW